MRAAALPLAVFLLFALGGCAGPAPPHVDFHVEGIVQESHPDDPADPADQAQVSFNVTANLTNVGTSDYTLSGGDWQFRTDTGIWASVGWWGRLPTGVSDGHDVVKPGQSIRCIFGAYQEGLPYGNITGVRFREEAVRPL